VAGSGHGEPGLECEGDQLRPVAGARHTGRPRTAPVLVDGVRYIIQAYPESDWVRNACAAGRGILSRGHRAEEVDLVQLPTTEAAAVLRAVPDQNPRGVDAFERNGLVAASTPDGFAAAADRCPVFRVSPRVETEAAATG
jgi:hypothetical protein